MTRTLDCFTRPSESTRPLPTQIGRLKCRWHVVPATDSPTESSWRISDQSSDYIVWFDDVSEVPHIEVSLERGVAALEMIPWADAHFLVSSQDPWSQLLFQHLPPGWAGLCLDPSQPAVVLFRRTAWESLLKSSPQPRPGWGFVGRLILENRLGASIPNQIAWDQLPADRLPPLTPAPWPQSHSWRRTWLQNHLPPLAQRETSDPSDQTALQAAVWQCLGELDLSHRLSQQHEGEGTDQMCDYWHAIMHRREPDYANSKYWFRQLGRHPVFPALAAMANRLLATSSSCEAAWRQRLLRSGNWDPFAMVDLTEAAAQVRSLEPLARRLQALELITAWEHLLGRVSHEEGR